MSSSYDAFQFGSETDLLPVWDTEHLFTFEAPPLATDFEFWENGYDLVKQHDGSATASDDDPFPMDPLSHEFHEHDEIWQEPLPVGSEFMVGGSMCEDVPMMDVYYHIPEGGVVVKEESCRGNMAGDVDRFIKEEEKETVGGGVRAEWSEVNEAMLNDDMNVVLGNSGGLIKIQRPKIEKRKLDDSADPEELDFAIESESSVLPESDEDDPTGGFKLPASKSPIMEAMVVCGLNGWGIDIVKNTRTASGPNNDAVEVVFRVTDFDRYYRISRSICSKQRPTDDVGSRVKSLRRWFVNFPKKKDRNDNVPFLLVVKPQIAKKVNEIIERNTRMLGLTKRRRRQ